MTSNLSGEVWRDTHYANCSDSNSIENVNLENPAWRQYDIISMISKNYIYETPRTARTRPDCLSPDIPKRDGYLSKRSG